MCRSSLCARCHGTNRGDMGGTDTVGARWVGHQLTQPAPRPSDHRRAVPLVRPGGNPHCVGRAVRPDELALCDTHRPAVTLEKRLRQVGATHPWTEVQAGEVIGRDLPSGASEVDDPDHAFLSDEPVARAEVTMAGHLRGKRQLSQPTQLLLDEGLLSPVEETLGSTERRSELAEEPVDETRGDWHRGTCAVKPP